MGNKNSQQQPRQPRFHDQTWTKLRLVFQNLAAFTVVSAPIISLVRNREYLVKIQEAGRLKELESNLALLEKDVREFQGSLDVLYARHSNRRGSSYDPDDNMRAIQIWEGYVDWGSRYQSVVLPTIRTILEIFQSVGVETEAAPAEDAVLSTVRSTDQSEAPHEDNA